MLLLLHLLVSFFSRPHAGGGASQKSLSFQDLRSAVSPPPPRNYAFSWRLIKVVENAVHKPTNLKSGGAFVGGVGGGGALPFALSEKSGFPSFGTVLITNAVRTLSDE